jgi:uncharacterized protein DUF4352
MSMNTGRMWCVVCLALGCEGPASSGAEQGTNAEPGALIPAGTPGRTPHFEMQVSVLDSCPAPADAPPDKGQKRVGVKVSLSARAELQVPANAYYAYLIDADNVMYEATLAGCEPALAPSLLEPGETANGWLSFDIPKQTKNPKLSYAPRLLTPHPEQLTFRLTAR